MNIRFLSRGPADQISGGYLYNKYAMEQMREAGMDVRYHGDPCALGPVCPADVVIVDSLVVGDAAARLLSLPAKLVLLLHVAPDLSALGDDAGPMLRALCRRSRVVVTGASTLRALRRTLGDAKLDALLIEPGVPGHWRAKERYSHKARALLGLANYVPGKGLEREIEVLRRVADLPWTLTLHGNRDLDPACFAAVARQLHGCGLASRVRLCGPIPHDAVNEKMLESDLLVHFSEHESYSMVTAEAVACGLPVFAHRTGNASGFEASGLVRYFDGDDTDATGSLRRLIGDERAYGELCGGPPRGRRRTWQDVGRAFTELLETL